MFGLHVHQEQLRVSQAGNFKDKLAAGSSLSAFGSSRMLEQVVWAEIKVGSEHLRLFSEQSTLRDSTVFHVNLN
jgi:hypothetical protein